jgi:hypothetical protein
MFPALKLYFIFFFPDQEEYDNPFFGASKCIRRTLQQFEFFLFGNRNFHCLHMVESTDLTTPYI